MSKLTYPRDPDQSRDGLLASVRESVTLLRQVFFPRTGPGLTERVSQLESGGVGASSTTVVIGDVSAIVDDVNELQAGQAELSDRIDTNTASISSTSSSLVALSQLVGSTFVQIGNVVGVPAGVRPTVSDTDAIQAALNACAATGGGTVIAPRGRSFRISSTTLNPSGIVVPLGVHFAWAGPSGASREPAGGSQGYEETAAFHVDSNATVSLRGGSSWNLYGMRTGYKDIIPRNPIDVKEAIHPDTMRECMDSNAAAITAGTFLTLDGGVPGFDGGDEQRIMGTGFVGFNTGIRVNKAARVVVEDAFGDAVNGVWVSDSGGMFRWARGHLTTLDAKTLKGQSDVSCPIVATFQEGTRIAVVLGDHVDTKTKTWKENAGYTNTRVKWPELPPGNLYKATDPGISGNAPPVHTSGRASDKGTATWTEGVDWRWDGTFTGIAYTPAVFDRPCSDGLGPWLRSGDPVFIAIDPVWFGGRILDPVLAPFLRGRVLIFQKHPSIPFCWVLDVPWDPRLAAAMIGHDFVVQPGSRPGVGFYSANADNTALDKIGMKGMRFGYWFEGSSNALFKCNFEQPAAGEREADDWGAVCGVFGEQAVDSVVTACNWKSAGIGVIHNVRGAAPTLLIGTELGGNTFAAMQVRRGSVTQLSGSQKGGSERCHVWSGANVVNLNDPEIGGVVKIGIGNFRLNQVGRSGGVATLKTNKPHGFVPGVVVDIETDPLGLDVSFACVATVIATPTDETFTVSQPGLPNVTTRSAASGGTATGESPQSDIVPTHFEESTTRSFAGLPRQQRVMVAPAGFIFSRAKPGRRFLPGETVVADDRRWEVQQADGNTYVWVALAPGGTCGPDVPQAVPVKLKDGARVGGVVTFNTSKPHGGAVGLQVTLRGAGPTSFDGTFTITAMTADTVTYAQAGPDEVVTKGEVIAQATDGAVVWEYVEPWTGGGSRFGHDADLDEAFMNGFDPATGQDVPAFRATKDGAWVIVDGVGEGPPALTSQLDGFLSKIEDPILFRGGFEATPGASAVVARFVVERACTFQASMAGSRGRASTPATAASVFNIQHNGTTVGSMRFNAGATASTWPTPAAPVALAVGDEVRVVGPATPDATLAGVAFALAATR